MTLAAHKKVAAVLGRFRFDLGNEARCQTAIGLALDTAGVSFQREAVLSDTDRIDFLCQGGVGIEVKVKGSALEVLRQLERYARHETVTALVLATARSMGMPAEINGKPVLVVNLGRAWL